MFTDIIKFLIEIFKNNYKAALLVLLLTPVYFYAIGAIFGVNIKDHLEFLVENSYKAERDRLVSQLTEFNGKIDEYEIESHKKLIKLWHDSNMGSTDSTYEEKLGIINRNQDVIRALLEFGKIYTSLVNANEHEDKTLKHLSHMYEALLYIIIHDDKSIEDAFKLLKDINERISDFPEDIRDDVKIEVLRYLSYCAAKLDKKSDQEIFIQQALKLRDKKSWNVTEYRRKVYWVDLSNLVLLLNGAQFDKADQVFIQLRNNLGDPELLKIKLSQHKSLIKDNFKSTWNEYIDRL